MTRATLARRPRATTRSESRSLAAAPGSVRHAFGSLRAGLNRHALATIAIALIAGLAVNGAAAAWYARAGFVEPVPRLWLLSLLLPAIALLIMKSQAPDQAWTLRDNLVLLALLAVTAPLYLVELTRVPFQISTDEVTIMYYMRDFLTQANPDWFGLSTYFGLPSMVFILMARLGQLLGGVNLSTIRLLNASCGLLCVLTAYVWLRAGLPRGWAALGALVLGTNHALIAISRMALRDDTSLLLELIAFAWLMRGLQWQCPFRTWLGGLVAGLAWYTYFPSRVTLVVWGLFLVVLLIGFAARMARRNVLTLGIICLAGWGAVVSPLLVAGRNAPADGITHVRSQLLLFPEGRAAQQTWLHMDTEQEAIREQLRRGLTVFNNRASDLSTMYVNPGYGFLDPLTGILLWIGVGSAAAGRWRRRERLSSRSWRHGPGPMRLFAATGLFSLWLAFTVIINKAPNYTRLLVLLPFIAYWAVEGVRAVAGLGHRVLARIQWPAAAGPLELGSLMVAAAAGWNIFIYSRYAVDGWHRSEIVGATARQVMASAARPKYPFYLVVREDCPYYTWGQPSFWKDWVGFFAGPSQRTILLSPDHAQTDPPAAPFTMFVTDSCWKELRPVFESRYPRLRIANMMPDGSRLAIITERSP